MNGLSFSQIQRIQFLAANYSRLQGLRGLPPGLLLFAVTFWANLQSGPTPRPILLPLLFGAAAAVFYWLIDRYYRRAFGKVIQAPRGHLDWIVAIGGGALALVAYIIEITFPSLPLSPTGLVLAAALLLDYLMLVHITQVWYMPFWPLFPLSIVLFSVLPIFGLNGWWWIIDARVQIYGVIMMSGLIMVVAAIVSHVAFTRMLPGEVPDGGRV